MARLTRSVTLRMTDADHLKLSELCEETDRTHSQLVRLLVRLATPRNLPPLPLWAAQPAEPAAPGREGR